MYFWPEPADVKTQDWASVPADVNGPALGDLILALVPVMRAAFLLGHRVMSVNVAPGTDTATGPRPLSWTSIELSSLTLSARTLTLPRPRRVLNVVLELEELSDLDPGITDGGFGMPLPAERLGTDEAIPVGPGLPAALQASIDTFVEQAVAALVPRMPGADGDPPAIGIPQLPKARAGGMVWLLDPEHWTGFEAEVSDELKLFVHRLSEQAGRVLTGQLVGRRGEPDPLPDDVPTLDWLFVEIAGNRSGLGGLSIGLRQHLQDRGAAHLLNHSALERLFWRPESFHLLWLDVLVVLVATGVIGTDGLLELAEPDDPLIVTDVSDTRIDLVVWGEATITLRRELRIGTSRTVRDGATWEYVAGDASTRPTLAIVAGRGISVSRRPPEIDRWDLAVFRVQSDTLVPDGSEAIEPWRFLTSRLIGDPDEPDVEDPASLLARPLPNGLHLEFPVFGGLEPPPDDETVDDDKPLPFILQIAVDPFSAFDWYCVDVSFYTYTYGGSTRTAAHLVVWTTATVTVTCSDQPGDNQSSPSGTDNGARGSHEPLGSRPIEPAWRVSAELWETAAGGFPAHWATPLPVTYELVTGFGLEPLTLDEPALTGTEGADVVPWTSPDGGIDVLLSRVPYAHEQFRRHEGRLLDLADLGIGLIPIIGDVADAAETAYAWQTGYDRWGRPVSDFQLALMTLATAVPFVSGSFARSVTDWVGTRPDRLRTTAPLPRIFGRAAAGFSLTQPELEEVLAASTGFARTRSKPMLVQALGDFVTGNPQIVQDYVTRVTTAGGSEWLSLSDLIHPTRAGFRINLLDDEFAALRRRDPIATVEEYLERHASTRARVLLASLLGPATATPRSVPKVATQPFAAYRPPVGVAAVTVTVTDIANRGAGSTLLDAAEDIAREVIAAPGSMRLHTLGHGGHIADARELVPFTPPEIRRRFQALLDEATGNNLSGATADELMSVVGNDLLNGKKATLHERVYRVVEALVTTDYEVRRFAPDASILDDPRMLGPLRDCVRQIVGRPRFPYGPRAELRYAAALVADFVDEPRVVLGTQQQMPDLLGKQLFSGADHTLYLDGTRAVPIQIKAVSDLNRAGLGDVHLVVDAAGVVVKVKGPDVLAQAVRDEFRRLPWRGFLPPAGMKSPPLVAPADPLAAGWVRDTGLRIVVLDDEFLAAQILHALYETARRAGTAGRTANLLQLRLHPGSRLMIHDSFVSLGRDPTRINLRDIDALRADIERVMTSIATDMEDDIARNLARFHDRIPEPEVVVTMMSEGTSVIRDRLGLPRSPLLPGGGP